MKKRVLAGIMMAAMVMASVMSVSATGSKQEEATVNKESEKLYETDATADAFDYLADITSKLPSNATEAEKKELKESAKEAQAAIKEINAGKIPESVVADIKDIKTTLAGKKLICPVFELEPIGGDQAHANCGKNGHKLKLDVPALKNCDPKSVVVLHYSVTRGYWEVVQNVDIKDTTLTGTFKDLSPVAIYAKVTTGGAAGTSPSTVGTSSTWMLWAAVAVVALGAGVVATQKKSR